MLKDSQLERGFRAAIYSGALAAGGYLVFCLVTGWNEVLAAVAKVGAGGVLVAVFLSLCNYGLRFVRWQAYLRALNHSVPWTLSLEIYLAGFSLTTTPGKAGEMLRSVLLRPWGVPFGASIAALLSERLSDVLAIVILALAGLSAHQSARPIFYVSAILVLLGILALSRAESVFGVGAKAGQSSKLGRWLVHLHDVLKQTRQCSLSTKNKRLSNIFW